MPLTKPLAQIKTDLQDILVSDPGAALKSLQTLLPATAAKKKDILMLMARLETAGVERRSGAFADAEIDTKINRVRFDFLALIDTLVEKDFEEVSVAAAAPIAAVPKFMIVYDVEAEPQATRLNKFLFLLKRSGKMSIYNVHADLKAGDPVEEAKNQLKDTDYILCLMTLDLMFNPDWLDFIWNARDAGKRVIPIRIADISLQDSGLEKFKSLPTQNRMLSSFNSEDAAFTDIVTEIRKLLPA